MKKPTKQSISELVTPDMANFAGKLHGGHLLALADKAAYVCATRFSGYYSVTASMDKVSFHKPVHIGELISFQARVIEVGTTSMTVRIVVKAEQLEQQKTRKVATCYATMVAMDDGEPTEVPDLHCENAEELREYLWAIQRKQLSEEYEQNLSEERNRIENLSQKDIKQELQAHGKLQ